MFLAWNEIKHNKGRYILITGVIFLIAYLVFLLSGLAYGLAQESRMYVDNWHATAIVLNKDANKNLTASQISEKEAKNVTASKKATLLTASSVIQIKGKNNTKDNVNLFGIQSDSFVAPKIVKGKMFNKNNEIVIDKSLADTKNYHIGDKVIFTGCSQTMKIVGMTKGNMFSMAPTIYMNKKTYQEIKPSIPGTQNNVNGIVVRDKDLKDIKVNNRQLQVVDIKTFINQLPGYSAQLMTFTFMISFLIIIAAIVIGIFIYVLTMQKKQVFGVMKIQGIPTSFIAKSVVIQTGLLAILGVAIGFIGTIGTGLLLPAAVPFQLNIPLMLIVAIIMILIAIIGSIFSVRSIAKIDPLQALN